jgi:hypothetical protein
MEAGAPAANAKPAVQTIQLANVPMSGSESTNRDGSYWGVSIDNNQDCAGCCNIVPNSGNISRTVRLT